MKAFALVVRKTYLFGQCSRCMREDAEIRDTAIEQAVLEAEEAEANEQDAFPTVNASKLKLIPQVGMPGLPRDHRCSEVIFISRTWMESMLLLVLYELAAIRESKPQGNSSPSLTKSTVLLNLEHVWLPGHCGTILLTRRFLYA